MIKTKYNGNVLELYDGIQEMPITRYQDYNRFILIDSGVGADMNSFDNHLAAIVRYGKNDDKENLQKEIDNLRANFYFIISKASPEMNAFACLIKTFNGKKLPDSMDSDLIEKVIEDLKTTGITVGKVKGVLSEVKKKLQQKMKPFFLKWSMMQKRKDITLN